MKRTIQVALIVIATLHCWDRAAAQPNDLNHVKVGSCGGAGQIESWIDAEERRALVIDTRPFSISQTKGKLSFPARDAHVAVLHMNPFVYDYRITVEQQELINTAVTDFLKLLLPQSLGSLGSLQSGDASDAKRSNADNQLRLMEKRFSGVSGWTPATCTTHPHPEVCAATVEMYSVFDEIRKSIHPVSGTVPPMVGTVNSPTFYSLGGGGLGGANDEFVSYGNDLIGLRNEQMETYEVCNQATNLENKLAQYDFKRFFDELDKAQKEAARITSLTNDLRQLAVDSGNDEVLKDKANIIRCAGFNCAIQFKAYADAVFELLGDTGYQKRLKELRDNSQEMNNMFIRITQMSKKDGLFARTFDVPKKFELSQATISVTRVPLDTKGSARSSGSQSGNVQGAGTSGIPAGAVTGGPSNEGSAGDSGRLQSGTPGGPSPSDGEKGGSGGGDSAGGGNSNTSPAAGAQINQMVQLGRSRFMLSGGLVYSPLARRTFQSVKGFVVDANGNPTGKGDADVVGFGQNSPRRLLPMVLLNSRLLDYGKGSMFFSFGLSAKHDDNLDLEYLVGPSVSLLNDRALFTFGAYGGLSQNLVSDLKVGQEIPDEVGDAKLFTKRMTWKPGFSFSYSFSKDKTLKVEGGGSAAKASPSDELKNEIRIGGIPFSLALGFAYTSLEQRTYDEVVGLARDRLGNLTNGNNLARIVGVTSKSNYRLTPLAMLHTRLTSLGAHDFYFTTGITGKKTDNDFDVEYLLGGSFNLYRRQLFLTVGTFVGKQQILGGNFFEGAALGKSQNVTTTNRYVWKPAISFSYDISKVIPR
jgi:hypothetical protein